MVTWRSLWPWPLTSRHQNLISSSLSSNKSLYKVWRYSLKLILRYRVWEKHKYTLWCHCDLWPLATEMNSKLKWMIVPNVREFPHGVLEIKKARKVLCVVTVTLTFGHQILFISFLGLSECLCQMWWNSIWAFLIYWVQNNTRACDLDLLTIDHQNVMSSSLSPSECCEWRRVIKSILLTHSVMHYIYYIRLNVPGCESVVVWGGRHWYIQLIWIDCLNLDSSAGTVESSSRTHLLISYEEERCRSDT